MFVINNVAINAYLATTSISFIPNVLLFIIPDSWIKVDPKARFNMQNILLCFAGAGLLGDVFLHSIPHLLLPHDHHDHHEQYNHLSESCSTHVDATPYISFLALDRMLILQLVLLFGFTVFFIGEKLANRNGVGGCHNHNHGSNASKQEEKTGVSTRRTRSSSKTQTQVNVQEDSDGAFISVFKKLEGAGWLNLIADAMHNFTDGIAVGVSFATSKGLAIAIFLSVIAHEIPHEIGDFTIPFGKTKNRWIPPNPSDM